MYSISRGRPVPKTWDGEKEVKKNLTPFLYASCHFFKKICHISREILRGHREVLFFGSTLLKTSLFDGGRVGNRSSALAKPPTSYKQHRASRLQMRGRCQCAAVHHSGPRLCISQKKTHDTQKHRPPSSFEPPLGGPLGHIPHLGCGGCVVGHLLHIRMGVAIGFRESPFIRGGGHEKCLSETGLENLQRMWNWLKR